MPGVSGGPGARPGRCRSRTSPSPVPDSLAGAVRGRRVLVVGTGEMGRLAAGAARAARRDVAIASRDEAARARRRPRRSASSRGRRTRDAALADARSSSSRSAAHGCSGRNPSGRSPQARSSSTCRCRPRCRTIWSLRSDASSHRHRRPRRRLRPRTRRLDAGRSTTPATANGSSACATVRSRPSVSAPRRARRRARHERWPRPSSVSAMRRSTRAVPRPSGPGAARPGCHRGDDVQLTDRLSARPSSDWRPMATARMGAPSVRSSGCDDRGDAADRLAREHPGDGSGADPAATRLRARSGRRDRDDHDRWRRPCRRHGWGEGAFVTRHRGRAARRPDRRRHPQREGRADRHGPGPGDRRLPAPRGPARRARPGARVSD